jgi:hypothetical protein
MDQQHPTEIFGMLVFAAGLIILFLGLLLTLLAIFSLARKGAGHFRVLKNAERVGPVLILIGLVLIAR